ncbi:maleylpyruvate isomerase N-terminal domain-containing protein [Streptomyces sp. NBC_01551]|uniref:maleylpyruvate isomerase N-terminal domain-containing protein n=1 Tax=Streptomyces sp. NBC_01551 TaxID=2975876 RepID=UPI002255B0CF|nr:maleylpyruvate isomerase N-terminal domain-containing protein [Streptomyces sp. NBC_01551]MCX4524345.1 maleylpyruvate isomerase N-terminal domain-containing protein [Streptomyces sp. NBC_01551]
MRSQDSGPSPGWSVSDLVGHLGGVHRYLTRVLRGRLAEPPDPADLTLYGLPSDEAVRDAWPKPERAPVPGAFLVWFAEGAPRTGPAGFSFRGRGRGGRPSRRPPPRRGSGRGG